MNPAPPPHDLPPLLAHEFQQHWLSFQTMLAHAEPALAATLSPLLAQPALWASLPKVWACSHFVTKYCQQQPAQLAELLASGDLGRVYPDASPVQTRLDTWPAQLDEAALMRALRLLRNREMVRLIWRDLAGWADLAESLQDISNLAITLVNHTLTRLYPELCQRYGTPCDSQGQAQPLLVIAMGKLGGRELNFSSDIDLIFTYPEAGETRHGKRVLTNQEFFVRLGQKLIQVLNTPTADGFVFRVDMRLRPFGDSGPLAMHFSALEDYYQSHAREWERYALIKARLITGTPADEARLFKLLHPFVYRRYLDFGAFESLRDLKAQIDQEVRRRAGEHNVKLGQGGIREIEFICQAFQMLRGGRQPALQTRHLLTTLTRLAEYQHLPLAVTEQLRTAYHFLRRTEHRLQAIDDRQTQVLPVDPLNRQRIAYSLGFADWDGFLSALHQQQACVQQHFQEVIAGGQSGGDANTDHSPVLDSLKLLWTGLNESNSSDDHRSHALDTLSRLGFRDPARLWQQLCALQNAPALRHRSRQGQDRLDTLLPLLLQEIVSCADQNTTLERILGLIEAVARRSVYLSLLIEHPAALHHLVTLCASSAWIAEQLTHYPLLLDELLDKRRLYDILDPEAIDSALHAQLAHVPQDDLEMQMDALRHFKRAQVIHVAAAELDQQLTVEVVSDYLTAIACALIRQTLAMAWAQQVEKYGTPQYREDDADPSSLRPAGFCVVAYGKVGAIEMSHSSDLDLVFLHNSRGGFQATDGAKSIENNVFFARLLTRLIHLLTTQTAAGDLYEVDQRLRPGGKSGLLVSSLDAFYRYQCEDAWTWEHQALVRARAVAGDPSCMQRFEAYRCELLSRVRDPQPLRQEVSEMRRKMRDNLDKSNAERFDLKQGVGGVTDIEFIVQYGVLRWAADYPDLLTTTGLLPMLRRFENAQLLDTAACTALSHAYRCYRREIHRLGLQNLPALVSPEAFSEERAQVSHWWQVIMESEN